MLKWKARRVIGMLVFLVSSAMLLWGLFPPRFQTQILPISPADMQIPTEGSILPVNADQVGALGTLTVTPTASSASQIPGFPISTATIPPNFVFPEQRRLVTTWPVKLRLGDTSVIRLVLELEDPGIFGTGSTGEGESIVGVNQGHPDLFDTYLLTAEARLEVAGMEFRPGGEISEAIARKQPVQLVWNVRPPATRKYEGTLWLHIRYIPRDGGEARRKLVAAQAIEIRGISFFGLSGNLARILGSLGMVSGAVIGLDLFSWFSRRGLRKRPVE